MTENNNKQAAETTKPMPDPVTIASRMRDLWSDDTDTSRMRQRYLSDYGQAPLVYLQFLCDPHTGLETALSRFSDLYCGRYYGAPRAKEAAFHDVMLRHIAASPARRNQVTLEERDAFRQLVDSTYDIVRAEGMCYLFRKPAADVPATT